MYLIAIVAFLSVVTCFPHHNHIRITGGTEASQGQFPFAVAIVGSIQICDGVILNNRWILTTAFCLGYLSKPPQVVLGDISLHSGSAHNINQTILYDSWGKEHNIALAQLEDELIFNENVQPIEIGEVGDNQTCTILGWGATLDENSPDVLQFAETSTINIDQCRELVPDLYSYIGPESVCTLSGQEDVGVCRGDMGGPLVCDGKLAAIYNYIIGGCGNNYPDIHAKVSFYKEWIENRINNK